MYNIGIVSKTKEVNGVTVKTTIKGVVAGRVDMMVKVDDVIISQGLGINYGDVTETLLNFNVIVQNHLSEKDESEQLADRLSKLGFKEEEE